MAVRRALISVSDKTGVDALAVKLAGHGIEILSTGGTARALRDAGVAVTDVSDVTGFPEIMDGRVKTLHPNIHGGLLGRRGTDDAVMAEHGITPRRVWLVHGLHIAHTLQRARSIVEGHGLRPRSGDGAS